MTDLIFIEISILLAITIGIAFIIRLLRQPLMVAYIIAGIICGPFILNLFKANHEIYSTFAQFGVVLLLFIIGLHLNFNHLKSIGKVSLITGIGQVIFTAGIGTLLLLYLNLPLISAFYLAIAITFSSTIIIMKLLSDKKDTDTIYGRYTIGLMLVQDLIAVLLVIMFGIQTSAQANGLQTIGFLITKLILVGLILWLFTKYILPKCLDKIAHSSELLFLFTLTWCFGIATLLYVLGFSLEMGAIISGITLSSSPYQLEIGSRLKPLRDFFLILFFIVLGSEMGIEGIGGLWIPTIIISLFILIGNPFILYILFRIFKFTRRNSFLAGITAAQVSEFGFVLLFAGRQAGHLQGNEVVIFTGVAIITIFISSYLITYNEQIYRFLLPIFQRFGPDKQRQSERAPKAYDAWVIGYHRIGTKVAETLSDLKVRFSVIDFDPEAIKKLRKTKIPFYFGDIADIEFLEGLPLAKTKIIIMTIPSVDDQIHLIKWVLNLNKQVLIIANAYHTADAQKLYEQGAQFVMMPHFLGAQWITKILKHQKWNRKTLIQFKQEQRKLLSN
ncbi:sodium:proton exchanger [Candidatus Uhrbacteria bacterium CG_4_9_14_3_um_filter_36_7]|uniref:Sodium:proton exchanger n=1 Tax=Candidatus Uhrbacteria bacterium CG_4_9_14_3_um_filter_36_7 TaxID=1975033 RepID=A0A2M7XI38_9BACT|nr:MAG: sodium:proton exchanger [Candidatus Uhrbacteria bacterium CG_4_9_14_3_um_filter_36_7]